MTIRKTDTDIALEDRVFICKPVNTQYGFPWKQVEGLDIARHYIKGLAHLKVGEDTRIASLDLIVIRVR